MIHLAGTAMNLKTNVLIQLFIRKPNFLVSYLSMIAL